MISCEEALELMSLELDGLLEEPDRRRLEEHMGQCAACRDLRKDLVRRRRRSSGEKIN